MHTSINKSSIIKGSFKKRAGTKELILNAAEELFAERGFVETSLRMITAKADVNLASVNYHYGSKKSLIQAVFNRYLSDFYRIVGDNLQSLENRKEPPAIEEVLKLIIDPLIELDNIKVDGTVAFMRLLSRAYSETQGHLRRFLMVNYGDIMDRFYRLLYTALPGHSQYEVFWRLHFSMGAAIFTFAGNQALTEISQSDFEQSVTVRSISTQLIPFLAAGLKASGFSPDSGNKSSGNQNNVNQNNSTQENLTATTLKNP